MAADMTSVVSAAKTSVVSAAKEAATASISAATFDISIPSITPWRGRGGRETLQTDHILTSHNPDPGEYSAAHV